MKKIIALLMLVTGITGKVFAQAKTSMADKTFEPPVNSIASRYFVDLGKGNKMELEMSDMNDIRYIKNVDSMLRAFLRDMQPLKDSLTDDVTSRRIDYVVDSMGRKKIRIQQYTPKGSSFLMNQGDLAVLKVEQDTIYLLGTIPSATRFVFSKNEPALHYYRISFFVNQLAELSAFLDGRLNEKMTIIQKSGHQQWVTQKNKDDYWHVMNGDPAVYAEKRGGNVYNKGDKLELKAGINLQNYKTYFVPSFSISADVFIHSAYYTNEIGLAWEPDFFLARNNQGSLVTYRNDFITLMLGRELAKEKQPGNGPHFYLFQHLSVAYLVRQKGDFIDNHTFRVGTGSVNLRGEKIKLEPVFYFHDLFKNVTPGLRLSVNF